MIGSGNIDPHNCITFQRVKQYPAKSITNSYSISWFQGTKFKHCFKIICFLKNDLIGFNKIENGHFYYFVLIFNFFVANI